MGPIRVSVNQPYVPGIDLKIEETHTFEAKPDDNIVTFISSKIPQGMKVLSCFSHVERPDLNSPPEVSTYYNKSLKKHCYIMNITWELTLEGKSETIQITQERATTLSVPLLRFPKAEADRAYQAFAIGTEYGKTISAIFDPNDPAHTEMLALKGNLETCDTLEIRLKAYDSSTFFHSYVDSSVSLKDLSGKKIKLTERALRDEIYKIDQLAGKIVRAAPDELPDHKNIFDGADIVRRDHKVTVKGDWFKDLADLEKIGKEKLEAALKTREINEEDYIKRISGRASDLFYTSVSGLNYGNSPSSPEEKKHMQATYDKMDETINTLKQLASQLEILLEKHLKLKFLWKLPGGTSPDATYSRWPPEYIRERIKDLQELKSRYEQIVDKF